MREYSLCSFTHLSLGTRIRRINDPSYRGLLVAARLKALGVDYLVIDRNANPGDNWSLRYDCLRFHVGKSFCETPYLRGLLPIDK